MKSRSLSGREYPSDEALRCHTWNLSVTRLRLGRGRDAWWGSSCGKVARKNVSSKKRVHQAAQIGETKKTRRFTVKNRPCSRKVALEARRRPNRHQRWGGSARRRVSRSPCVHPLDRRMDARRENSRTPAQLRQKRLFFRVSHRITVN